MQERSGSGSLAFLIVRIIFFTLGWYIPAVGLTFYNRWMFKVYDLHYPISITCFNFLMNGFITYLARKSYTWYTGKPRVSVPWDSYFKMVMPTSVVGALDIGLTNTSLLFIPVTFLTGIKSSSVVFIVLFAFIIGLEKFSWKLFFIISMITSGIIMTIESSTAVDPLGTFFFLYFFCFFGFMFHFFFFFLSLYFFFSFVFLFLFIFHFFMFSFTLLSFLFLFFSFSFYFIVFFSYF